jgi:hypothetical protein
MQSSLTQATQQSRAPVVLLVDAIQPLLKGSFFPLVFGQVAKLNQ